MSDVRSRCRLAGALAALAWVLLGGASVHADTVIYNSLTSGGGGNYGITDGNGSSYAESGPLADSFSTGSVGFYLTDVQVRLIEFGTIGNGSSDVELYSDSATSPGTLLTTIGTLADTQLTSGLTVYSFTLSTPYLLAANTRYWIGVSADPTNGSVAAWGSSDNDTDPGVYGQYIAYAGSIYSTGGGNGSWNMELSGNAVPEPSAMVSALLGVVCVAGYAACRKRKTAAA